MHSKVPLTKLQTQCQKVNAIFLSEKKKKLDPGPCLEIFRRAVVERDDIAWEAFITIYSVQVRKWLQKGFSCLSSSMWEEDELVLVVFERFAKSLTPERYRQKLPWTLGQVMAYLRKTTTSLGAEVCHKELMLRWTANLDELSEVIPHPDDATERMLLWESILQELTDEKERLVAHCKFIDNLPPREILESYPDIFADKHEVIKILRRIKARIGRRMAQNR